jgi:gas vesicle protein
MTTEPAATDAPADVRGTSERTYGFVTGLIAGSAIGLGLGMLFAPRAVLDLRTRAAGSAKNLGKAASDRCHEAGTRIGAVVNAMTRKGQDLRADVADAVVRGAQNVEQDATNAKTGA